jgi:hypothetical protein
MTPAAKKSFRQSALEAGEKISETLSAVASVKTEEDAKAVVVTLERIEELMREATQSVGRALNTMEVAAGYAPYKGKL